MKKFILTGTPGCGKTSIIRALENLGHYVIHEAATDIIAHEQSIGHLTPWGKPNFVNKIVDLQKQREIQASNHFSSLQFYDRSPICTYALAIYLNVDPSEFLLQEIERIKKDNVYENKVFFIENLGFCAPTNARKISFKESLVFEKIHIEAYAKFGYECLHIPKEALLERVNTLLKLVYK